MSWNQLVGQVLHTRTYGYIAIVFWLLNTMRVRARSKDEVSKAPSFFDAKWVKVLGGVLAGLVFAACADPWLPVRFSLSYFKWSGSSDRDRKSTRLNSSHLGISYAVFCLKKKTKE